MLPSAEKPQSLRGFPKQPSVRWKSKGQNPAHILTGLFTDTSVVGDDNDINVDELPLDYDILEQVDYKYPAGDNYFAYTTRGCPNHCSFCAVPIFGAALPCHQQYH